MFQFSCLNGLHPCKLLYGEFHLLTWLIMLVWLSACGLCLLSGGTWKKSLKEKINYISRNTCIVVFSLCSIIKDTFTQIEIQTLSIMNCHHHLRCILQTVMLTHSGFWPRCPDREQTASVDSALGQIKIETLNYSERLLQAVWIPKWFASPTHYDSSQAVLINVIGGFSDCIWSQVWHNLCPAVKAGIVCPNSY